MSAKISQNANGSDMAVIDIKISKTIVFGNVILQIIVFKVFTKHNYVTQCCIFQCFPCWGDQITRILNMMMSYGCVVFDVFQVCFLEMCYKVIIEYWWICKPKGIAFVCMGNVVYDKSSQIDFNPAEIRKKNVSQIMVKIIQIHGIFKGSSFYKNMWLLRKKRDTLMSIPVILIIVQINSLYLPALNYGCKNTIIIS